MISVIEVSTLLDIQMVIAHDIALIGFAMMMFFVSFLAICVLALCLWRKDKANETHHKAI